MMELFFSWRLYGLSTAFPLLVIMVPGVPLRTCTAGLSTCLTLRLLWALRVEATFADNPMLLLTDPPTTAFMFILLKNKVAKEVSYLKKTQMLKLICC